MVHEEGSITIEKPVQVVFDFLLDGMNNPLWRKSVLDSQRVPGKPNTYKQGMKGPTGRMDGDYEITEIKPNERIAMRAIAGLARPTSTYVFEALGSTTRVTFGLSFEGKGPGKLMEPLVATVMRGEIAMLPNLKACLEQPAQATAGAVANPSSMTVLNPNTVMPPPGGYSQGIAAGGLIFVAGQVGVDVQGKIPGDGGMAVQTRQTIDNVAAVLAAAGASLKDVVSTTVYIKDLADYKVFNQVWNECFGGHKPARATVLANLVMPQLLVEIQAIAVVPQAVSAN